MEEPSISELPDELILKIFSLLPLYEESIATRLLNRLRMEGPWKLVPNVSVFDDSYNSFVNFMSFVYASLLFNESQILERFHLMLNQKYSASDINVLVKFAVKRSVRKLRIQTFENTLELPSCLSSCVTLKSLILRQLSIEVEVPYWFRLPLLKSLHLLSVKFSGNDSVAKLIQNCPVLEDLVINKTRDDNVLIFNINAPSLRSLSIDNSKGKRTYIEENHGFVINAPSLEKMDFKDTFSNLLVFEHMPEVTEANIQVICDQSENFIGSLTSIRHLSLCCLSSETPYPSGTTFPYLEHLDLCTCSAGWANLLVCILNDAPRLKHLKLKSQHGAHYNDPMILWKEPTVVPECLSTHLEIMEWRQYEGTEQERNVAAYILANTTCLNTATFSTRCRNKHHRMLRKLKKLNRVSETCQLLFD
ncbi:unnamed protein product [Brassica napus]|uniref:(rape) hypothetical protein n=1 Tax=Brassica napus TaxID=3708 RepID=A0A816I3I9_BRANA|nr:unnamed protein product [Brassica napus]